MWTDRSFALYPQKQSGEETLLQIPSSGGKIFPLDALKQDFHSFPHKFIWKEDGKRDESRRRRISRWAAVEVTALAKIIFPCSCLHLWRYSKPDWTWSYAIHSKWPCFSRGVRWSPKVPSNPNCSVILCPLWAKKRKYSLKCCVTG